MKYAYFVLIFSLGFVIGRYSAPESSRALSAAPSRLSSVDSQSASTIVTSQEKALTGNNKLLPESKISQDPKLLRTDDKAKDKEIRKLYSLLMIAGEKNQTDEQNRLFREMEAMNPHHEVVFQTKAMFLEEDEDWQGAHDVLKECVSAIPHSNYCLRRLANIRSSTVDERLRYGIECIEASKNDPFCLVDVAIALGDKGDFGKAKEYFEQALSLPQKSEGYNKEYILYRYGYILQKLGLIPQAKTALSEACRLNMKSACEELRVLGR